MHGTFVLSNDADSLLAIGKCFKESRLSVNLIGGNPS